MKLGPTRIFDSRKARERYKEYKSYRSSDFVVPPGYLGVVELFAPEEYFRKITFTAVRIPTAQTGEDSDCYNECGIGKRYRRWKCAQTLGDERSPNSRPTKFTEYNGSVVYWGYDPYLDKIVEFEYIVRPGTYYLVANRCDNEVLDDCINPTIIEFSLQKHYPSYHDLDLPAICDIYRPNQIVTPTTVASIPDTPTPTPTPDPGDEPSDNTPEIEG